jgi:hypothetical protein
MAGRPVWPVRVLRVLPAPMVIRSTGPVVSVAPVAPAVPVAMAVLAVRGAVAEAALGLVAS